MADPLDTPSEADGALLGRVADEVADRLRRGERPDLSEYARQHPRIARLILEGLPLLELLGPRKASAAAVADPERLGPFEIVRRIGRGGMAAVYEAREPALGRTVALKVLAASVAADPSAAERFRREARAVALLHHTNIVPVFAVGEEAGAHFFAMQLIRGRSLDRVLRDEGSPWSRGKAAGGRSVSEGAGRRAEPVCPASALADASGSGPRPADPSDPHPSSLIPHPFRAARVALQVAEALAHAHGHGVVHRDVKPSNILLDESGTAWLTDFGLAKVRGLGELTRDGEVVGTLRFMAPECFHGEADARADVYGLGMTLYELVTRQPAFGESDRQRLLWQVAHADPPRPRAVDPNVPRDLETIVRKATAKEPDRRYQTAGELADDLRRFLDGRPIAARRPAAWELAERWVRRNPLTAGLTAGIFLLLGAAAVGATLTALRLSDQKREIGDNLTRAERAEGEARAAGDREAEAKRAALRRAWEGMLTEAALTRAGPNAGRRGAALARLEEAAGLLPEVPHDAADVRRLRDLVTATLLTPDLVAGPAWERPASGVRLLGFDGQGRYALGTLDGEVRLLRGPDQPPEWTGRAALDGAVLVHAAFSPDGRYVAALARKGASAPPQLVLWRVGRPEPAFQLPDTTAAVFSPDSRLLVCVRGDRTVEFRGLDDGVGPAAGPANLRAAHFAFAPDGGRYAYVTAAGARVVVRDTAKHDGLESFPVPEGAVTGLAWLPDGGRVAVGSTTAIHVLDARTGAGVQRLTCAAGFNRASPVSCSGEWLAAAGSDGLLRVWDAGVGGEALVTAPVALQPIIRYPAFAGPDLVACQLNGWQRFRFEPADGYRRLGASHKYEALAAAMPAGGRWLAVPAAAATGKESVVYLWDLAAGTATAVPAGPGPVDALLAEPDGSALYALSVEDGSGRLRRWSVGTDGPGLRIGEPADVSLPVVPNFLPRGSLALSPDGRFVALAGAVGCPVPKTLWKGDAPDPGQRLFRPAFVTTPLADFREGKWSGPLAVVYPTGLVHGPPPPKAFGAVRLAIGPDARWLAMARSEVALPSRSEPAQSVFWDLSAGSPRVSDVRYPDSVARQVAFSPDGRWLVEGTRAEYRVRTPGTWEVVFGVAGEPAGRRSGPAAFSPDGRLLAVARSRRGVTLVRTGTWEEVGTLPVRQDEVLHWMGFTGDGDRLVAASATAAHVWDLGRIRSKWRELGVDAE